MQVGRKFCRRSVIGAVLILTAAFPARGQQGAGPNQFSIKTNTLPRAFPRQLYRIQLEAQGGVPPFTWKVSAGSLPSGISFGVDGVLSGAATTVGNFSFVVTVTDNDRPAHERNKEFVLQVVPPLSIAWGQPPKINGQRIEGTIKVTNQTETTFDLTAVVLAVNEIGRATAIGYQRFPLKPNTIDFEIPFGENLPPGAYEINADVVAEVAEINAIYRARLVTSEKLQMRQGP